VRGDEFAQTFDGDFGGVDGGADGGDVSLDDDGDVAAAEFFAVFRAVSMASKTAVNPWVSMRPTAKLAWSGMGASGIWTDGCSMRRLKSGCAR